MGAAVHDDNVITFKRVTLVGGYVSFITVADKLQHFVDSPVALLLSAPKIQVVLGVLNF